MRRACLWSLLLALTLMGACSSDEPLLEPGSSAGGTSTDAALVTSSGVATLEAGRARIGYRSIVSGDGGAGFTGEGEAIFPDRRGRLTLDLAGTPDGGEALPIDATIESIYDGSTLYLRSPLINSLFSVDTPWLRLDLATLQSGEVAPGLAEITQLTGANPNASLALVGGVVPDSVKNLGEVDVRGTPTTQYVATVDLESATQTVSAFANPEQWAVFVDQLGVEELPITLYLDAEGRIRRLDYEQALPDAGGSQSVEIEFFDFGAAIDVAIPEAGQVTDLTQVLQRTGS